MFIAGCSSQSHLCSVKMMVNVKVSAASLLASFNSLQIEYEYWLRQQQTSFIESVKRAQLAEPHLIPQQLTCLQDFISLSDMVKRYQRVPNSRPAWRTVDTSKLDQYLTHWHKLEALNSDLMKLTEVMLLLSPRPIDDVTDDNSQVMEEVRTLNARLIHNMSTETHFSSVSGHTRDTNKCTTTPRYRLLTCDTYLGDFITFIPQLIQLCTKICFLIQKLR